MGDKRKMIEIITKKICDICGKEMKFEHGYLKLEYTIRDYLGNGCANGGVDYKDVCDSCGAKINDVILRTIKEIKEK